MQGWKILKRRKTRYCVKAQRLIGPEATVIEAGPYSSRESANAEKTRLEALPEKGGFSFHVTTWPGDRVKPLSRTPSRRGRK